MKGANTWRVVKQAMAILQQLQGGQADKQNLMKAVQRVVPDAYRQETKSGRDSSFDRDLQNLRERLSVGIEWDPRERIYQLVDLGPLFRWKLLPTELEALVFLLETFPRESETGELVHPLLTRIQGILLDEQYPQLQRQSAALYANLARIDEGEISPKVWDAVHFAAKNRRVLRFDYLAPRHEGRNPRTHKVEPYELRLYRGHLELNAYCLHWRNPHGYEKSHAGWFRYRLDRILPAGLEVMPNVLPPGQRRKRLISIKYVISPELARGGISRHFEEMTIGEPGEDGWVPVSGKTDNRFEAKRILLAYGEHCQVISPPELRREMATVIREMMNLYQTNKGSAD